MTLHTTAYAEPQDVFDLLGMLDSVTMEPLQADNTTYPTYNLIQRRLLAYSDEFDTKTHDTWRVNEIKDFIFARGSAWHYANTPMYSSPIRTGGWFTQLNSPILPFDPDKGDKLEIRRNKNEWTDISDSYGSAFWFDYQSGGFYYMTSTAYPDNSFRISYRYGRDDTPPYDIQDAVAKMCAIWVMQTDWYRTKIGGGGDLQSKGDTIRLWREDINTCILNHMYSCDAVSLLP